MPRPVIRTVVSWFCWAVSFLSLHADAGSDWSIQAWQLDDGLPNNSVTGVAQTPDGYLWVATPSRLARFDGVEFEAFSARNVVFDHDERISALLTDRQGAFWLAMDHGPLACLASGKVTVFSNDLPDLNVQALVEDADGAIWISYHGAAGTVCRVANGRATSFTPDNGFPGRLPCV